MIFFDSDCVFVWISDFFPIFLLDQETRVSISRRPIQIFWCKICNFVSDGGTSRRLPTTLISCRHKLLSQLLLAPLLSNKTRLPLRYFNIAKVWRTILLNNSWRIFVLVSVLVVVVVFHVGILRVLDQMHWLVIVENRILLHPYWRHFHQIVIITCIFKKLMAQFGWAMCLLFYRAQRGISIYHSRLSNIIPRPSFCHWI